MKLNDELLKELAGIIRDTKDFCLDQAPSVMREFIMMERFYFFFSLVAVLTLAPLFAWLAVKSFRWSVEIENEKGKLWRQDVGLSLRIGGKLLVILSLICLAIGIDGALRHLSALIAPKWHIVKYFLN